MPQRSWNSKRERQYEHIRAGARQASRTSVDDMSPQRRGGQRSGNRQGPGGPTKAQLYNEARQRNIAGRSSMNKRELQRALGRG